MSTHIRKWHVAGWRHIFEHLGVDPARVLESGVEYDLFADERGLHRIEWDDLGKRAEVAKSGDRLVTTRKHAYIPPEVLAEARELWAGRELGMSDFDAARFARGQEIIAQLREDTP